MGFGKQNLSKKKNIVGGSSNTNLASMSEKGGVYTWEEIRKHRFPHDAWMVLENKVYNVSSWYDHPGGNVIFTHAGDDFTDIFAAFHPPQAREMLKEFCIGVVEEVR